MCRTMRDTRLLYLVLVRKMNVSNVKYLSSQFDYLSFTKEIRIFKIYVQIK